MKKASVFLFTLFTFSFFTSCEMTDIEKRIPHSKNPTATKTKINKILEEFARTEENKDKEGHRALFVSPSSRLNFVFKNNNNPFVVELERDIWIEVFSGWDYDYYPVYSNVEYYIEQGVAIDRHDFQGYKNGEKDIYGTDLFMYVETDKGLKILNISSTIVNPDDQTDYASLSMMNSSPQVALESFEQGINGRDSLLFNSAFTSLNASCFRIGHKLKEAYSDELHSAKAFYKSMPEDIKGVKLELENPEIDIHDQLTAVASSEYSIYKDGVVLEKGKILATLVATPASGWKISSMALSVSAQ